MKNNLLKVGFIGLGNQSVKHLEIIQNSNKTKIEAVCDVDKKKSDKYGFFYNCKNFMNYKDMIRDTKLDLIFVCIPHNLHLEVCLYALKNNLSIIKEKPFAINLNDAYCLIKTAEKYQQSIFTVSQRRYHPTYSLGKQWLNEIGKPYLMNGIYTFNGPPYNYGWRGIKSISGGGAILDMGYHMLDLYNWYLGIPESVYALSTNEGRDDVYYETEDTAILNFDYGNVLGNLVLSRASDPKEEQITVYGTKSVLKVNRTEVQLYDLYGNVIKSQRFSKDWTAALNQELIDWTEVFYKNHYQYGYDQLKNLELVEAIYKSIKSKKNIRNHSPITNLI